MCQKDEMEESHIKNIVRRVSEGQFTIIIPYPLMDQTVGQKQSKNSLNNFDQFTMLSVFDMKISASLMR